MNQNINLAVIGGSGLYNLDKLQILETKWIETPFGKTSDEIIIGELDGKKLAFLPRHGKGHRLTPSEVPYRANIMALKMLGAPYILSVSAIGSLKEEIAPGDAITFSQIFDRSKGIRKDTFFGEGVVGHMSFAEPICDSFRKYINDSAKGVFEGLHDEGTYVSIEGPRFSSRAESNFFRQIGADVIGMTAYPEAALAAEAGIHYATLALVTDYDCWRVEEEPVTVEAVLETMHSNVSRAKRVIENMVTNWDEFSNSMNQSSCHLGSKMAVMTAPEVQNNNQMEKLGPLWNN